MNPYRCVRPRRGARARRASRISPPSALSLPRPPAGASTRAQPAALRTATARAAAALRDDGRAALQDALGALPLVCRYPAARGRRRRRRRRHRGRGRSAGRGEAGADASAPRRAAGADPGGLNGAGGGGGGAGAPAVLHRLNDEEVCAGPMPPTGFRLRFVTSHGIRVQPQPLAQGERRPADRARRRAARAERELHDRRRLARLGDEGVLRRRPRRATRSTRACRRTASSTTRRSRGGARPRHVHARGGHRRGVLRQGEGAPPGQAADARFWRLPPVLVIHRRAAAGGGARRTARDKIHPTITVRAARARPLRSLSTRRRAAVPIHDVLRRKLHNLVRFPVRGLDLSPYLVPDGARAGADGREGRDRRGGGGWRRARGGGGGGDDDGGDGGGDGGAGRASGAAAEPPNSPRGSRSSEAIYDLYAVVHHLGALSAGHYVASVKAADGKWRCFNDSQVIETDEKELVSERRTCSSTSGATCGTRRTPTSTMRGRSCRAARAASAACRRRRSSDSCAGATRSAARSYAVRGAWAAWWLMAGSCPSASRAGALTWDRPIAMPIPHFGHRPHGRPNNLNYPLIFFFFFCGCVTNCNSHFSPNFFTLTWSKKKKV